ncbi:MAG: Ger(x)C family spore germination protein [Defluviitaleaceae bacterium]|nr:Ger(x)C family spore germination protein [Defluviitaleaceae bacterium]
MSSNEKITMRQLQVLIFLGAMGTGVIVLPRRAANLLPGTWQDGWLIALGLTVAAMLIGALICAALKAVANATRDEQAVKGCKDAPAMGFIESTGFLLTKPVAYVIGAALWAKLVIAAGLEMRVFMEITGEVLLPLTPAWVVSAVVLAVCAYAAAMGIETRARVGEVLLAVMILPAIFLFIFAAVDADFSNLQPVMVTEPRRLVSSVLRLGFIFTGMETLLLVSPFVPRDKPLTRTVVNALALAGIVITAITAMTIAAFGQGVATEAWPVLRMMDMINLPGSFIERQEALMFSFWIITAFALGNAMLFFGGLLVRDIFQRAPGKNRLRNGVLLTAAAVFAVSCIPLTRDEIYRSLDILYATTGLFFLVALPFILIFAAKISSWGQRRIQGSAARTFALMLILASAAVLLTGCWDRVEIENRAFVVAMGIDKASDSDGEARYRVTLSVPILGKNDDGMNPQSGGENDNEDDDPPPHIRISSGQTITEALKKLDSKTDKQLYYGQTKLLVLGTGLLEDPGLVDGVINIFDNMLEIDTRMHVLAAEDAAKILYAKPPGETLPGLYVSEIYRHKNKIGGTAFALDFERFSTAQRGEKNNGAIVPKIYVKEDELQLYGAVVLKDRRLTGHLTPDELRGFLWCFPGGGKGAIVTCPEKIPMKVESHAANINFEPIAATSTSPVSLRVTIDVTAAGRVEEYHKAHLTQEARTKLQAALAREISQEIAHVAAILQKDNNLDGFDFLEHLRKKNYSLYKQHSDNWREVFPTLQIIPRVKVEVKT